MPSERSPFGSPVEPISPPPKPAVLKSGLGWRRRVPPPGPKDLFRCPFIAIAALADGVVHIRVTRRGGKGPPGPGQSKPNQNHAKPGQAPAKFLQRKKLGFPSISLSEISLF